MPRLGTKGPSKAANAGPPTVSAAAAPRGRMLARHVATPIRSRPSSQTSASPTVTRMAAEVSSGPSQSSSAGSERARIVHHERLEVGHAGDEHQAGHGQREAGQAEWRGVSAWRAYNPARPKRDSTALASHNACHAAQNGDSRAATANPTSKTSGCPTAPAISTPAAIRDRTSGRASR
jgi:hypothetical protein